MLSLDKFAKGTINKSYNSSKGVPRYIYDFSVYSKNFEGFNRGGGPGKRKGLNKEYLVGYNSSNPNLNHMFFDLPYVNDNMLDSLNVCCSPQDFVDSWMSINK